LITHIKRFEHTESLVWVERIRQSRTKTVWVLLQQRSRRTFDQECQSVVGANERTSQVGQLRGSARRDRRHRIR
jgi:hypothetical protein